MGVGEMPNASTVMSGLTKRTGVITTAKSARHASNSTDSRFSLVLPEETQFVETVYLSA